MCAQLLIKKQYPNITGLDSTILQEVGSLKPFPPGSKSLQILHTDGNHWIAASNIGCTTTEDIMVYDSMYTSISASTRQLLSQLVYTDKPTFSIRISPASKQSGNSGCGVYAIAFIISIAFGLDPALSVYDQNSMRDHLLTCFERKQIHVPSVVKKDWLL